MPVQFQIVGKGNRIVEVSPNGELAIAPLQYSTNKFNNMNVVDTAFNFQKPIAGKQFVITGLIISTSRTVGVNGATIEIYEADSIDSTSVDKTILRVDMIKNQILPLSDLNSITTEGKFLNGKTDDIDVLVTILGYAVNTL